MIVYKAAKCYLFAEAIGGVYSQQLDRSKTSFIFFFMKFALCL